MAHGPPWLWWLTLAGFLAAFLATELLSEYPQRRWPVATFLAQAVLSIAVVLLLTDGSGFTPVILVFSAALSCYVLPRWATAAVIAINTVVVTVAASGDQGWLGPGLTALFYLFIQVASVLSVISWQRQEAASRALTEAHVKLSAAGALLAESTRAAERLRISRDLHDVVGHQLSALALELEVAGHQADPPAREHVRRARGIAKDLLTDIRGAVSDLRDDSGDLRETLQRVIADIPTPAIHLTVADGLTADEARITTLVRAIQEIVTNTLRHARDAKNLWIDVSGGGNTPDQIVLAAHDDGWGPVGLEIGSGLQGIRERAEQFGGSAEFSRGPQGGFAVRLEVPAT